MNAVTPRMRMFAGPNGSGKSVLKGYLKEELLGLYLNPDEIEAGMKREGCLDLSVFDIDTTPAEMLAVFTDSEFLKTEGLEDQARGLRFSAGRLEVPAGAANAYFASVAVAFLRQRLLARKATFTFETVMSHPGKVALLKEAQHAGYRTYLYYVATDDPDINVSRVRNRVALGGHPVPEEKIVDRYHRSLGLLMDAIKHTNRAYIFDNSTDSADHTLAWVAEITEGRTVELKTARMPPWFRQAVWDKIPPTPP